MNVTEFINANKKDAGLEEATILMAIEADGGILSDSSIEIIESSLARARTLRENHKKYVQEMSKSI